MLKLALTFELRSLLRSRASLIALLAFLAVGVLAIVMGQIHVAQWHEALATASEEQTEKADEARAFLAEGQKGPEDKPWVDLTQPRWQDYYASTRVTREPGPLAGVAAGAVDPAPVVFEVNQRADPLATRGDRIENPQLDPTAADLAFVFGMLAPLLIGVFGLEVASRERQDQIDRLLVVQAGDARSWLLARMVAVTALAGSACVALCLVAGLVGGAGLGELATLIGMVLAYVGAWGGLVLALNARASTIRSAALSFGAAWTLLCVLLPTVAAELAISRVEADFAVADTLDARAFSWEIGDEEPTDLLPQVYALHPELAELPAALDEEPDPKLIGQASGILKAALVAERHEARLSQEREAQLVSERVAWLTPMMSLSLGLERLAGVGPEAASDYRGQLVRAIEDRSYWVASKAWTKQPLGAEDFEALAEAKPPLRAQAGPVSGPLLSLLIWALVAWIAAFAGLTGAQRRQQQR